MRPRRPQARRPKARRPPSASVLMWISLTSTSLIRPTARTAWVTERLGSIVMLCGTAMLRRALATGFLVTLCAPPLLAGPFVPAADDQVLLEVPQRVPRRQEIELEKLRMVLARDPKNP